MHEVKRRFREKGRCLWGGVSGAITVELGTEDETEAAVKDALFTLGEEEDSSFRLWIMSGKIRRTPGEIPIASSKHGSGIERSGKKTSSS